MFEIGDVVNCRYYGQGTVVELVPGIAFPIIVEFPDIGRFQYTVDGKFFDTESTPALTLVERPSPKPQE